MMLKLEEWVPVGNIINVPNNNNNNNNMFNRNLPQGLAVTGGEDQRPLVTGDDVDVLDLVNDGEE